MTAFADTKVEMVPLDGMALRDLQDSWDGGGVVRRRSRYVPPSVSSVEVANIQTSGTRVVQMTRLARCEAFFLSDSNSGLAGHEPCSRKPNVVCHHSVSFVTIRTWICASLIPFATSVLLRPYFESCQLPIENTQGSIGCLFTAPVSTSLLIL